MHFHEFFMCLWILAVRFPHFSSIVIFFGWVFSLISLSVSRSLTFAKFDSHGFDGFETIDIIVNSQCCLSLKSSLQNVGAFWN